MRTEYFQSVSTEEAVSTVLSRMKGMYALADRSKGLNGIFQKQIKETTATVIGAITVLHQRLAGMEVNDQLESFSRQIRRLEEENRRMRETMENIQARESTRTGERLLNTTSSWGEELKEQRIPRRIPQPPRGGRPCMR